MEEKFLDNLINILKGILNSDSIEIEIINRFQREIWEIDDETEKGSKLDILRDLAIDLEYYVPDPNIRREDFSYYGDDRAREEIKIALGKIEKLRNK